MQGSKDGRRSSKGQSKGPNSVNKKVYEETKVP